MGYKYRIEAFNYPYKGYYEASYGTKNLIKFIIKLIIWKFKYFGVNATIRNDIK